MPVEMLSRHCQLLSLVTSFLAVIAGAFRVRAVEVGRWQVEAGVLAVELDENSQPESCVDDCDQDRDDSDREYDGVCGV